MYTLSLDPSVARHPTDMYIYTRLIYKLQTHREKLDLNKLVQINFLKEQISLFKKCILYHSIHQLQDIL